MVSNVFIAPASWKFGTIKESEGIVKQLQAMNIDIIRPWNMELFIPFPDIRFAHILTSGFWSVLMIVQTSPSFPKNRFHRWIGRLTVFLWIPIIYGYIMMELRGLTTNLNQYGVIASRMMALSSTLCLIQGFKQARNKNYKQHEKWMIRHFACGGGAVILQRLFLFAGIPLANFGIVNVKSESGMVNAFSACAILAAFFSPLTFELLTRKAEYSKNKKE
jgi:hypothetical protein